MRTITGRFSSVAHEGPITVVTLSRPDVLNALHYEAELELDDIWRAFAADPAQRIAILTGAGERAFCVGNDLKAQAATGSRPFLPTGFGALTARTDIDKPVIAAINGMAIGGGFEMALACDLLIADEQATFALPEPRVGLAAIMGGAQHLSRILGLPRANGILLTGRRFDAQEAWELGLLTALAPAGQALARAFEWAQQIVACSPCSLRVTREVARGAALGEDFGARLQQARQLPVMQALRNSPDYAEGPKAFAEKRPPVWQTSPQGDVG